MNSSLPAKILLAFPSCPLAFSLRVTEPALSEANVWLVLVSFASFASIAVNGVSSKFATQSFDQVLVAAPGDHILY
jgi:hypothetical protein